MHKILQLYNKINKYGLVNGLELTVLSPGNIHYEMPVMEEHLATPVAIHGGVLAAMMDAVLGVAALSLSCESGKLVSTVEFKINYLAPARPGDILVGEGRVVKHGNTLLIAEGEISTKADNKLIGKGIGTFYAYPLHKSGIIEHLDSETRAILGEEYL